MAVSHPVQKRCIVRNSVPDTYSAPRGCLGSKFHINDRQSTVDLEVIMAPKFHTFPVMTSGVPGPESVSDHAETPPDRPQTSQGHSSGPLTRNMTPAQAPGPATARETREPGENAKNAKNSKNAHSAHTHASAHDGKRVRRIFPWLQVTHPAHVRAVLRAR